MKKIIILTTLMLLFILSSCGNKSVDDIYSMMDTEIQSNTDDSIKDDNVTIKKGSKYKDCDKNYIPQLVEQGTSVTVISQENKKVTISFRVDDALASYNISALKQLTTEENYNNIINSFYKYDSEMIDENGNASARENGIKRKFVCIKLGLTNELTEDFIMTPANFNLLDLQNIKEDGLFQYNQIGGGYKYMDTPDAWEYKLAGHLTLHPGEEKEVVFVFVVDSEWLDSCKFIKDGKEGVYTDLKTGGPTLNNVYMTTSCIDSSGVNTRKGVAANEALLHLNIRNID